MDKTHPPLGIEELPNGEWVVEGDTHLGLWAKQKGTIITDPNVFKFLKPHLERVHYVLDIGANIGDHTRQYLNWGMQVVAVEPHPVAFECLRHNCPDAMCLNLAASDVRGTANFTSLDNVGASRIREDGEWTIPCEPLDDLPDLPAPGFVKIDVEGHEPKVLAGMRGILERHRPIVFCEINRGALAEQGFEPEDIYTFFENLGYPLVETLFYPSSATTDWPQYDVLYLP